MFKKLVLAVMIVAMMAVSASAAELKVNALNIQGDTLYLPSSGSFAVGVGTNIASIGIVDVRGMLVTEVTKEQDNKAGIGIGVNLPKLVDKLGGSWLVDKMNASVGVTALINLDGTAHVEPAVYISLINMEF